MVPPRMCTIIKRLHDGMNVFAQVDGDLTEPFDVSNSLMQGCVLAPVIFDMFSYAMIDYWRILLMERTTFERLGCTVYSMDRFQVMVVVDIVCMVLSSMSFLSFSLLMMLL